MTNMLNNIYTLRRLYYIKERATRSQIKLFNGALIDKVAKYIGKMHSGRTYM